MNAHGIAVQRRYGRSIMHGFHGWWSAGTLLGAGTGAIAAALDVPLASSTWPSSGSLLAGVSVAAMPLLLRGSRRGPLGRRGWRIRPSAPSSAGPRAGSVAGSAWRAVRLLGSPRPVRPDRGPRRDARGRRADLEHDLPDRGAGRGCRGRRAGRRPLHRGHDGRAPDERPLDRSMGRHDRGAQRRRGGDGRARPRHRRRLVGGGAAGGGRVRAGRPRNVAPVPGHDLGGGDGPRRAGRTGRGGRRLARPRAASSSRRRWSDWPPTPSAWAPRWSSRSSPASPSRSSWARSWARADGGSSRTPARSSLTPDPTRGSHAPVIGYAGAAVAWLG